MTRAEHLAWAKQRALEYVDINDGVDAIASMLSDLAKHTELEGSARAGGFIMITVDIRNMDSVRKFINDFN